MGDKPKTKDKSSKENAKQESPIDVHAPQKVAYPVEHDLKENKWLRMARKRSQKKP